MSGLAEILIERGYKVSGSDMNKSLLTDKLTSLGAEVFIGHNRDNIDNVGLLIYTAAIPDDNPELMRGKELNIPMLTRAELLGKIMKGHKYNVAISGTHGKTTTTSMISHITLKANLDPTILVGGELDVINGNIRTGKSEYFITEACEYKASFLEFYPYIGIILNIDADHLDYYKDLNHIKDTFSKFIDLIPKDGYLIANADDVNVTDILGKLDCNLVTFGISKGDIKAQNITFNEKGCASFEVVKNDTKLFDIALNVPGKHNVLNSLAAIATALNLKIDNDSIIKGLLSFGGTHRRFELKGVKNGITVIDDYAHHPTEIKATLAAIKNYPHKKVFCIFQPHTYTRTSSLFDEFSTAFLGLEQLILADIYAAREKDTGIVNSKMLSDAINKTGVNCINLHSFDEIVSHLKANASDGDLILTVGAGDVYKIGEMFLK